MKRFVLSSIGFVLLLLLTSPLVHPAFASLSATIEVGLEDVNNDGFLDIQFTAIGSEGAVSGVEISLTYVNAPTAMSPLLIGVTKNDGKCVFYDMPVGRYSWKASQGSPETGEIVIPVQEIELKQEDVLIIQLLMVAWIGESEQKSRAYYAKLAEFADYDLSQHPYPSPEGKTLLDFSRGMFQWLHGLGDHLVQLLTTKYAEISSLLQKPLFVSKALAFNMFADSIDMFERETAPIPISDITDVEMIFQGVLEDPKKVDNTYSYVRSGSTIRTHTIMRTSNVTTGLFPLTAASFDAYLGSFDPDAEWWVGVRSADLTTLSEKTELSIWGKIAGILGTIGWWLAQDVPAAIIGTDAHMLFVILVAGMKFLSLAISIILIAFTVLGWIERYPSPKAFIDDLVKMNPILLLEIFSFAVGLFGLYMFFFASLPLLASTVIGLVVAAVMLLVTYFSLQLKYREAIDNLRGQLGKSLTNIFRVRTSLYATNTTELRISAVLHQRMAVYLGKFRAISHDLLNTDMEQFFSALESQFERIGGKTAALADSVDEARPKLDELIERYLFYDGSEGSVRAHLIGYNATVADYKGQNEAFINNAAIGAWSTTASEYQYRERKVTADDIDGQPSWRSYSELKNWANDPPTENDTRGSKFTVTFNIDPTTGKGEFKYDPKPDYLSYDHVHNVTAEGVLQTFYQLKFYFDEGTTVYQFPDPRVGLPTEEVIKAWQDDLQSKYDDEVRPCLEEVQSLMEELALKSDKEPPTTTFCVGWPARIDFNPLNVYVNSRTPLLLNAQDNKGGSGVFLTSYRIYNATYDTGWIPNAGPYAQSILLNLPTFLKNGQYDIDFASTDWAGNRELTKKLTITLTNLISGVKVDVLTPTAGKPATAGLPDNPQPIYVPVFTPDFDLGEISIADITVEIGGQPASAERWNPISIVLGSSGLFNKIFVLKVIPPTQTDQGKYDLDVTITYHGIVYSEVEKGAVQYGLAPEDTIPPSTTLSIGGRQYTDRTGNKFVTSQTSFTLTATDNSGGTGVRETAYRIYGASYDSGWLQYTQPFYLKSLTDGTYNIDYRSTDNSGNTEATKTAHVILDNTPPTTQLTVGEPKYVDLSGNIHVNSATLFKLSAEDNAGGSGTDSTFFRVHDTAYSTDWRRYTVPFSLASLPDGKDLADGTYYMDYYSTDKIGNREDPPNTAPVVLDNTAPIITDTNFEGMALQDGVTLEVSTWDLSAVASVWFTIQCTQGETVDSGPGTPLPDGKWEWYFDTAPHPDGPYVAIVTTTDVLGNSGDSDPFTFTIRNWACIELLPASESNKAGRTMPTKFSLRVVAAVDPAQPFVRNEELTIKIYAKGAPGTVLQASTYGTTSTDYRIDPVSELYITNFKTLKSTPKTYIVEVYRKDMLIGTFEFKTVK